MLSKIAVLLFSMLSLACVSGNSQLSDKHATAETAELYENLKIQAKQGIMFGHQDDLAYGVNWRYEAGRSDVRDVTGDYPAVYGWDLGGTEHGAPKNIDGVPFDSMREWIRDARRRGGVVTLSWHMDNPLTGKNAWDTTHGSVSSVLPGGSQHEKFKVWLGRGAAFIKSLTDDKGKAIPVLYRPYHELTGNWFWWCKNNCTPEEFVKLWKFTIGYFEGQGIHNLIYVYNTSGFSSEREFLEYYPGPEYADVLSFDNYQYGDPKVNDQFVKQTLAQFKIADKVATGQNKLLAFAETGYEAIPDARWWTRTLMSAMGDYPVSYVLVWRNHGWNAHMDPPRMHYYAPYPGQESAADFVKFYNLPRTLFEKDVAKRRLYTRNSK